MDMLKIVEAAKANTGAKSNRDLSLKMGWAPNYVFSLLEGTRPSEEALATLLKAAGQDPTAQVLQFMRDKHTGDVKKILDRALKALTAACVIGLGFTASPSPSHAAVPASPAGNYTLCDK